MLPSGKHMPDLLTREQAEAIRAMSARLGGSPVLNGLAELGPPERRAKPAPKSPVKPARRATDPDPSFVEEHLRRDGNGVILDMANVLRVLERHPDFAGRFRFNAGMGKICDCGKVLLGWQIDELTAVIQERFLPAVPEATVAKAVAVVAHRASADRG